MYPLILLLFVGTIESIESSKFESNQKLTVLASIAEPFVIYDKDTSTLKGLDVNIVKNFAKKFNLQMDFIVANESLKLLLNSENRLRNLSQFVLDSKIEILIGALDENPATNKLFVGSRPYYHDSLTWCVQKRKHIPLWRSVFYLCNDPYVYFVGMLAALSLTLGAYLYQPFEPHKNWNWNQIFYNGFATFLNQSFFYKATFTAHRIGLMGAVLGGILLSTIFSSKLIMYLTNPILKDQIATIGEIIVGDFHLVGDQYAFEQLSRRNETYSADFVRKLSVTNDLNTYLQQLDWDDKLAVAISNEHAQYAKNRMNMDSYCFNHPHNIHEYSPKLLVRQDFPFLNELNRFIEQASDGGIMTKWIKTYSRAMRNDMNPLEDVSFIFGSVFHNCGMILAFIILMIEKIVYKKFTCKARDGFGN